MPLTPAILCSTFIDTVTLHLCYQINTCIRASKAFDDVDEEDNEGEEREDTEYCGEEVDVVDEDFVCMGQMDTEVNNSQYH